MASKKIEENHEIWGLSPVQMETAEMSVCKGTGDLNDHNSISDLRRLSRSRGELVWHKDVAVTGIV